MTDHLAWSIGLPPERAAQGFDGLVTLGREQIQRHFPASRGYELQCTKLGGPIDGICWQVTRGPFVAQLGIQRFARAHGATSTRSSVELRVIASAGSRDHNASDPEALERRVVTWALAGWGLGSVGLGALLLGASGVLSGWGQMLLLVPAVAAWRASMASLVRRANRSPRALPAAATSALPASPQVEHGLERWQDVLEEIRARRDELQSTRGLPPFRQAAPGEALSA
ncbi:MAG: hypothetical protein AAF799_11710 [Myxococcota bacterium]